jgi:TadE-like protein
MQKRIHKTRAKAQALVEFALAATLIFFLLAAVVDLGLIYFTMQALRVAAQEGANYGSYTKATMSGATVVRVDLDTPQIVGRIYGAAGDQSGGFANLRDLNNNGRDDLNLDRLHDNSTTDPNAYIYIENLKGADPTNLAPACRGDVKGVELQNGGLSSTNSIICWIRVTVRYEYRFLFPLAPAFGDTVRLQASHLMPIRSTYFTGR